MVRHGPPIRTGIGADLLVLGVVWAVSYPSPSTHATGSAGDVYSLVVGLAVVKAVAGAVALSTGLGRWVAPRLGYGGEASTGSDTVVADQQGVAALYP